MLEVVLIVEISSLLLVIPIGLMVTNALVITRLRREHPEIYESIGAPGWVFGEKGTRNSTLFFAFGCEWKKLDDSILAKLCWIYRGLFITQIAILPILMLTPVLFWIFSSMVF